jgi:hypothetical protein
MKKFFLLSFVFFLLNTSFSYAQIQRKTKFWTITGQLYSSNDESRSSSNSSSSSYGSTGNSDYNSLNLEFKQAKFIKDGFARGFLVGTRYGWSNYIYNDSSNNTDYLQSGKFYTLSLGYSIAKYIPVIKNTYLYVEGNPNLFYGKNFYEFSYTRSAMIEKNVTERYGAKIQGFVGIRYFFNKKVFINADTSPISVNYEISKDDNYTSNNFYIRGITQINSLRIGIGKNI